MATIERRKIKGGRATAYRVKWRTGGGRAGQWDGETFDSYTDARRWRALVEASGQCRPPVEQLREYGFADRVRGLDVISRARPPAPPAPPAPSESGESSESGEGRPEFAAQVRGRSSASGVESAEGLARGESRQRGDVPTFAEFAEAFIAGLDHVIGYTRRRYRSALRSHVVPVLGGLPIDKIEYEDVQWWQRAMVEKGLSRKTIANIRGTVLVPVFKVACRPRGRGGAPLRYTNPLEGLRLPAGRRKRRDVITNKAETPPLWMVGTRAGRWRGRGWVGGALSVPPSCTVHGVLPPAGSQRRRRAGGGGAGLRAAAPA